MLLSDKYSHIPDEILIEKLRAGNSEITDYLLEKYKNVVKKKARAMFLIGGDTDDLIQEGMIGLYKATRDFSSDKEASFLSFANMCISRQIYTAVNASKRKKHSPLNSYISFYDKNTEDGRENSSILEAITSEIKTNPEEIFIDKENVFRIEEELESLLSKYEKEVLRLYIDGNNYHEIAERMDKKPKSIDNAIQRIKNKVNYRLTKINL